MGGKWKTRRRRQFSILELLLCTYVVAIGVAAWPDPVAVGLLVFTVTIGTFGVILVYLFEIGK